MDDEPLSGDVEVDETSIHGKPRKLMTRSEAAQWREALPTVLGMVERGGRVRARVIASRRGARYDGADEWPVSYRHYGMSIYDAAVSEPPEHPNAHVAVITIGYLVFLAYGNNREPPVTAVVDPDKPGIAALQPIWPALGGSIDFPPPGLIVGSTGLDALADAFGDVAAFQGRDSGLDGLEFAPRPDA
jgi:hypothetical protein